MTIDLAQGQAVDLKDLAAASSIVRLGLGWDRRSVERRRLFSGTERVEQAVDLDASALLCNDYEVLEIVSFRNPASGDGSVTHSGDNRTGDGEGDDEFILVRVDAVSPEVQHIYFSVNSFKGGDFSDVDHARIRVSEDEAGDRELARFGLDLLTGEPSADSPVPTAVLMARLS